MLKLISHLLIASLVLCFAFSASAASVSQVKGNRVLINLEGDEASSGDKIYLLNANGKRVGIVNVTSVKGGKAIGTVTKGKAQAGFKAQVAASASSSVETKSTVVRTDGGGSSKLSGGVLMGFGMQSMALKAQFGTTSENVTLKGNAISLKAFGDYKYSETFTLRAATGLEPFKASGSTSQNICSGGTSTSCEVTLNYITFEGALQYNIMNGPTRAWVGLGYAFLLEMSKSINVPNLSATGKTNQMLLFGGGADIGVGKSGSYIPVVIEYGMFPGSSNVSATSIFLRSGYAIAF